MNFTDVSPSPAPSKRSRRKYLLLALAIVVPVCLIFVGVTASLLIGRAQLEQVLADTDQLDPYWRLPDLEAHRAGIPDAENGLPVALAAESLLPQGWPHWPVPVIDDQSEEARSLRQALDSSFNDLPPPVQLNNEQVTALRAEVRRAEPALDKARRLVDFPNGRAMINWAPIPTATPLPHLNRVRTLASALSYDALLRAQISDLDGALANCRACINAGRCVGDEPTLISQLVRVACRTVAERKIERILAQGEPSPAALATLQRELEREGMEPLLLYGIKGERACSDSVMESIQEGRISSFGLRNLLGGALGSNLSPDNVRLAFLWLSIRSDRAGTLRFMNRAVEVAKLPPERQRSALKALMAETKTQNVLLRLLLPAVDKVGDACNRTAAEYRSAALAIAAERYRREQGRWPGTLTELVPRYIDHIPTDPFDGAPLRLGRFAEGILVYSVGYDGQDNGGAIDLKNPTGAGADLGFRLWDVGRRRQSSRPLESPASPADRLAPAAVPPKQGS
jgi:hypothetical protein